MNCVMKAAACVVVSVTNSFKNWCGKYIKKHPIFLVRNMPLWSNYNKKGLPQWKIVHACTYICRYFDFLKYAKSVTPKVENYLDDILSNLMRCSWHCNVRPMHHDSLWSFLVLYEGLGLQSWEGPIYYLSFVASDIDRFFLRNYKANPLPFDFT